MIEKIRQLWNIAEGKGGTEAERDAARNNANRLMKRYGISVKDLYASAPQIDLQSMLGREDWIDPNPSGPLRRRAKLTIDREIHLRANYNSLMRIMDNFDLKYEVVNVRDTRPISSSWFSATRQVEITIQGDELAMDIAALWFQAQYAKI